MNVKDLKPTYTIADMVKMFREVDKLTREKNALAEELATIRVEVEVARQENANLTAQLYDLQGDFARQMTAPRLISVNRRAEC